MSIAGLARRFRSAITGRFVSRAYAKLHRDTTVSEQAKNKRES